MFQWKPSFRSWHAHAGPEFCWSQVRLAMSAFSIVARVEPDALIAAAFGAIPFTLGLGYFLDSTLIRRDARAS